MQVRTTHGCSNMHVYDADVGRVTAVSHKTSICDQSEFTAAKWELGAVMALLEKIAQVEQPIKGRVPWLRPARSEIVYSNVEIRWFYYGENQQNTLGTAKKW